MLTLSETSGGKVNQGIDLEHLGCNYQEFITLLQYSLTCVWLGVGWVGLDPT